MKTIEEINRICPYKSNEWQQGYGIWQSGFIEGEKIGAEEQRKIDIEKACEWLKNNYQNLDYINYEGDLFDLSLVKDFRKAMEEENMKTLTRHEQDGLLDFICEQYLVALRSHKNGVMNVNQFSTIQSRAFRMAEIVGGKEGVDTLISRSEACQDRYQRQEVSDTDKTPKKGGRP